MAEPRYLSVDTFRKWTRNDIDADESIILTAIHASEEWIDQRSDRYLSLADDDTADVTRKFRPGCTNVLRIPDFATITTVEENGTVLVDGTDYQAEPFDKLDRDTGVYRPFDRLVRLDRAWYRNGSRPTVEGTGKPGWASIPAVAIEAACILTNDWLQNRNIRLGVVGATGDGFSIGARENPFVISAIDAIRGPVVWGIA